MIPAIEDRLHRFDFFDKISVIFFIICVIRGLILYFSETSEKMVIMDGALNVYKEKKLYEYKDM